MTYIRIALCFSLILAQVPPIAAGDTPPAAAQTFDDWIVLDVEGQTLYAKRSDFDAKYAASKSGKATEIQRIPLYAFKFNNAIANDAPKIVSVTATDPKLELKIYPRIKNGPVPLAGCPPGKSCDGSGKVSDQSASVCDSKTLSSCQGELGAKWERSQPIDVTTGKHAPVFGNEDATLRRLPPKDAWVMASVRGFNKGSYDQLMKEYQQTGKLNIEHARFYVGKDGPYGDWATKNPGKISPADQAYLDYMAPEETRKLFNDMLADKNISDEKRKELAQYVRTQTVAAQGGKDGKAGDQIKYLAKHFKGVGGLDDETAAAFLKKFDSAAADGVAPEKDTGDGDLVVPDGVGTEKNAAGEKACQHKGGCDGKKIVSGKEVPLAMDGPVKPKQAGMLSGLGKVAKNKFFMGGAGMLLGAVLGFMFGGPIGMMMGGMAMGFMGAGIAQVATNNSPK